MKQTIRFFTCLLCGLWFSTVWCTDNTTDDLNIVTVPVAGQSTEDRQAAFQEAFTEILVRLSGHSDVMDNAVIKQESSHVKQFIQQYRYDDSTITVTFDHSAIVSLLKQAREPVWLSKRPRILVWLSINKQFPLTQDSINPSIRVLQNEAQHRGLSLVFPGTRDADLLAWQTELTESNLDLSALAKMADRYQLSAILLGQMSGDVDELYDAQWFFIWEGQAWQFQAQAQSAEQVLSAGINKAVDVMASRLAFRSDQNIQKGVWLAVFKVTNLEASHQVVQTLQKLSGVIDVRVVDVGPRGLLLYIETSADDSDALIAALNRNTHFSSMGELPESATLRYRWVSTQ